MRPLDSEEGGLEELLVGVLLADALLREAVLDELLHEHGMTGEEVLLREPRVVDERRVLKISASVT